MAEIPFPIFVTFLAVAFTIGIIGIIMGIRKIQGAPFITVFAGILIFALLVLSNDITVQYLEDVSYTLEYPMNVTTGTTQLSMDNTVFARAEEIANTNSRLYNKPISCIGVTLTKVASPTGNVQFGVLDGNNNVIKSFGNISASSLSTTDGRVYTKCLSNHDFYILSLYDRVGVKYTSGDATNKVNVQHTSTNDYDGINSIRSAFTTSWVDNTADDVRMILIYDKASITEKKITYAFDDNDVWAYMIFLSAMFIFIGVILQIQKW